MSSARRIVLACLSVLLFLSSAPPARAGWGWLEKLSGPGPFEGFETPTVPVWCFDADSGTVVWKYVYPCKFDARQFEGGVASTPTIDGSLEVFRTSMMYALILWL